jgi:hypothetical protein
MIWHIFKSWHGHLARVISKYYMGGTPMPLRVRASVHGSRLTVEKKESDMKIERFEDIEAWRLGRKLARKALKMS